jgi:hypothetical protein
MTNNSEITLAGAIMMLKAKEVTSVEFVHDYIQFHFNSAVLSMYTMPSVITAQRGYLSTVDPGYRDALCSLIGRTFQSVQLDRQQMVINFSADMSVTVSLRDEDYVGPEALVFSLDDERMWIA